MNKKRRNTEDNFVLRFFIVILIFILITLVPFVLLTQIHAEGIYLKDVGYKSVINCTYMTQEQHNFLENSYKFCFPTTYQICT